MPNSRHLPRQSGRNARFEGPEIQRLSRHTPIYIWSQSCDTNNMKPTIESFPARFAWSVLLLILFTGPAARAAKVPIVASDRSREVAFARYITSYGERDAFANSGPVGVLIEASLPKLYKEAALVAIRMHGEHGGPALQVLQMAGDATVTAEVIERYLAIQQQLDLLPHSSVIIAPSNYNFHFAGEVKTGDTLAYIYDIAPKKKRPGLVSGQLWIDSGTGHEVMLSGHMLDPAAASGRVGFVRDTKLINGSACGRITHVTFEIPLLGRAEVSITEVNLTPAILSEPQ